MSEKEDRQEHLLECEMNKNEIKKQITTKDIKYFDIFGDNIEKCILALKILESCMEQRENTV